MSNPSYTGPADHESRDDPHKTPLFGKMKPTAVRLGPDLRALLDGEAARAGVSLSQYMREAALARAAFAVGARGGVADELLAGWARALFDGPGDSKDADRQRLIAALAVSESRARREGAAALRAESRQAHPQARRVTRESGRSGEGVGDA